MDLTGARRRLSGAEAVLRLRALRKTGDLYSQMIDQPLRLNGQQCVGSKRAAP